MIDSIDTAKFVRLVHQFEPESVLLRAWHLEGGISAQVTAIQVQDSGGTTKKMVVRRHGDADLKRNPNVAADEFRLLQILHGLSLAVPAPVYVDPSGEFLSTPCIVVEYLEGKPELAPADLGEHIRLLAAHLASIHRVNDATHDLAFLPDQHKMISTKLHERPETLDESLSEGSIRARLEIAWNQRHYNPSVLLHGDFWPGNLLWQAGALTGIIDWEDAALGDPLSDLAITRLEVFWAFGYEAMEHFTGHYQSLMPSIDFGSLPLWDLVAALRPAFEIAEWAGNAKAEQRMRERHQIFVAQALERLDAS
jgi:aminoglycoside phosphotransferase (APT) family kinase protein